MKVEPLHPTPLSRAGEIKRFYGCLTCNMLRAGRARNKQRAQQAQASQRDQAMSRSDWSIDPLLGHRTEKDYSKPASFDPIGQEKGAFLNADDAESHAVARAVELLQTDGQGLTVPNPRTGKAEPLGDWEAVRAGLGQFVAQALVKQEVKAANQEQNDYYRLWTLGRDELLNDPAVTPWGNESLEARFKELQEPGRVALRVQTMFRLWAVRMLEQGPKSARDAELYFRYLVWPVQQWVKRHSRSDRFGYAKDITYLQRIDNDAAGRCGGNLLEFLRIRQRKDNVYPGLDPHVNHWLTKFAEKYDISGHWSSEQGRGGGAMWQTREPPPDVADMARYIGAPWTNDFNLPGEYEGKVTLDSGKPDAGERQIQRIGRDEEDARAGPDVGGDDGENGPLPMPPPQADLPPPPGVALPPPPGAGPPPDLPPPPPAGALPPPPPHPAPADDADDDTTGLSTAADESDIPTPPPPPPPAAAAAAAPSTPARIDPKDVKLKPTPPAPPKKATGVTGALSRAVSFFTGRSTPPTPTNTDEGEWEDDEEDDFFDMPTPSAPPALQSGGSTTTNPQAAMEDAKEDADIDEAIRISRAEAREGLSDALASRRAKSNVDEEDDEEDEEVQENIKRQTEEEQRKMDAAAAALREPLRGLLVRRKLHADLARENFEASKPEDPHNPNPVSKRKELVDNISVVLKTDPVVAELVDEVYQKHAEGQFEKDIETARKPGLARNNKNGAVIKRLRALADRISQHYRDQGVR